MEDRYELKSLNELFYEMTKDLTIQQWREIRTDEYWKSDRMINENDKLRHKIKMVQDWKNKNK